MKRILLIILSLVCLLLPSLSFARTNVDYWYIKNFETTIDVNDDSSLDITENITADCGIAQKHGIFRILPTFQQITSGGRISSPVKLESITDFDGNKIKYTTTNDRANQTITYKIGDANKFVSGVNNYRIKYHVKNAVRHNSQDFDEFYWNLSGNFWDIPIDSFSAKINFPQNITAENSKINVYSGAFGDSNELAVTARFADKNQISLSYDKTMDPGVGITLSTTFPKNIINPYVPTFFEKNGKYFSLNSTIDSIFLLSTLEKIRQRPQINPTIAPEFEIPEKLSPIDMGIVYTDGILKNHFLSASIINLAVKGHLKIKKLEKKGIFGFEDYELSVAESKNAISKSEQELKSGLFSSREEVNLSDLRNEFYRSIPRITDVGKNYLASKKWLIKSSRTGQVIFIVFALGAIVLSFMSFAINSVFGGSILISGFVILIFSFLMTRRSAEGAELFRRIKGFRLYMETAEKYRQKFNEKENIFEKFLPYAIMFGITSEWIKKMRDIYGEKYFATYHPIWFIGSFNSFNIDNLSSEISHMSSSMASTMTSTPSSSGSGGGGFSGGGGGGGGGGGW